jgi:hypothetical protein
MLSAIAAEFGIGTSHSVSRVTMEQKVTVETQAVNPSTAQAGCFEVNPSSVR